MAMDEKKSLIAEFFRDKNILVTGASGVLGKAVVEKLLRSCPGIQTIYLLLRPKKNFEANERLEKMLKLKLFERLKSEQPDAISKVVAIPGDIEEDGLGLSASDEKLITENVSVVFHVAASVKMTGPVKEAFEPNVLGTMKIVELCRKMHKLEVLIYTSTAYCRCPDEILEGAVHPFSVSPKKIIDMIEWMDSDLAEKVVPHLLIFKTGHAYSYTKALTEAYLEEDCHDLPIAIVRPSIVTPSWKEPFPGWIESMHAATGPSVMYNQGLLRVFHFDSSVAADFVPVDVVSNCIIAAAWHTAISRPKSIVAYNCTSTDLNGLTWGQYRIYATESILRYPSNKCWRSPSANFTRNKIFHYILIMITHYFPALCLDLTSLIKGQKARFVQTYRKFDEMMGATDSYLQCNWKFKNNSVLMLQGKMSPEDRKEFDFNIKSLCWSAYIDDFMLGIREFILREDPSTLPAARKRMKRLIYCEDVAKYVFITIVLLLCVVIFWR